MSDARTGVWETVRRVLGRLVGSVRVRELPAVWALRAPAMTVPEALGLPPPDAGTAEADWTPVARTLVSSLPLARAGAGGEDLASLTSVVRSDAALRPVGGVVHASAMAPVGCLVHRLDQQDTRSWPMSVRQGAAPVPAGRVVGASVRLAVPGVARLPMAAPALPRATRRPRPGRLAQTEPLPLPGPRVRSALPVAAGVPLTRIRVPLPPGVAGGMAFAPERRRLALAAGVAEDDVTLLGVFPQVPVAAVRRLALEENGALSLWLKPEALAAAAAGRTPRLVSLIVGRRRSTGKMIQTVA